MTAKLFLAKVNICEEAPVDLILNGKKLVTFMCTPENLNELAVGYLYSRGLISNVDDIQILAACDDMRKINVKTANEYKEEEYGLAQVLTSGCGSGTVFTEEFLNAEENNSQYSISIDALKSLSTEMFSRAVLYKKMGGMHCACLADENGVLALREDVGRHNAVDKVIGKGLFLELEFSKTVIMTTGRISSDMILKAVAAGFPIVVSRSIPSSLALEIAGRMGITVVGRIAASQPIIYTHPQRIITNAEDTSICSEKLVY